MPRVLDACDPRQRAAIERLLRAQRSPQNSPRSDMAPKDDDLVGPPGDAAMYLAHALNGIIRQKRVKNVRIEKDEAYDMAGSVYYPVRVVDTSHEEAAASVH